MIRYSLQCERGHAFESWFQSSAAYESQVKRKLVSCPACGSARVEKAIMAPRIVGKKGRESAAPPPLATFRDGVAGQAVIDAMRLSSRESRWVEVTGTS